MFKPSYRNYLKLLWERFRGRGLFAAVLATLAFVLAVIWAGTGNGVFEPWANLMTLCAATAAVLASVWASMHDKVPTGKEGDRYSLSYALAYGYVHNFLVGAIEALKTEAHPGKMFVFKPAKLDQLDPATHEAFKSELVRRGFQLTTRTLDKASNRPRGVLSVYRPTDPANPIHFVDFPTTLLTLSSLIAYQAERALEDEETAWTEDYRNGLAKEYIDRFFKELSTQADKAGVREWIDFTDTNFRNL
ncbi:MAG TPA: STING domain-containing protein [Variovorax sp.]|nr:STING domain-containing protein [Variovorax sp.]